MRTPFLVLMLVAAAGCAKNLPSFPYRAVQEPDRALFTRECSVRATPLVFDEQTRWGGTSEAEFVATLNTGERNGQEALKRAVNEQWLKQLEINERDYLGNSGRLSIASSGGEKWVLRSVVVSVERKSGALLVRHEVVSASDGTRVGEFTIERANIGNNFRTRVTTAVIPQAWTVLKYFQERFGCGT